MKIKNQSFLALTACVWCYAAGYWARRGAVDLVWKNTVEET